MGICFLNVSSKVHLKLGPARYTRTMHKARPEPYTFLSVYCIIALFFYTRVPQPIQQTL